MSESKQLELKVAVPTIGLAALNALVVALAKVAVAFGLHLTQEQTVAVAAAWVCAQPFIGFVLGYIAPHTHRPDLYAEYPEAAGT